MITDAVAIPNGLAVVAAANVPQAPQATPVILPATVSVGVGAHLEQVPGEALVRDPVPVLSHALMTVGRDVMALSLCPLRQLQQSLAAV